MAENNEDARSLGQPNLTVLLQYVKDLSFENPDAPRSLGPRRTAPNINIGINVQANPLDAEDFEIELRLEGRATDGDQTLFVAELVYAGVFRISNVPSENLPPLLMIECPRLLFPFARQILADMTRNGGFPPLLIDPVDFTALYRQRLMEFAQNQPSGRPS
ncbi:protein-export chaperone SecB [Kaistia dalseonensis]|uniref:Protein-export protein SecB n=1 Tax=Kaistia dalseonensis TaxID=410840 RepID=A0ABU0H7I3_9HYPH|nr:protein-export chaperone SecB [Kaistia dalseonensis]MCX5494845.1 protein-export chaperone SecB [Kaistia dalseonensis]MDQ0437426.1 preprotein translocase subunit SecB [Kaistia dalseonensis]